MKVRACSAAALLFVVFPVGMYVVATRMQSPEEVMARAQPPEPSVVTAPVEQRLLRQLRKGTCTVAAEDIDQVLLAGSGGEEAVPVITSVAVAPGEPVEPGDVVVEVAGRPRIVLEGPFPLYRDLHPTDEGPDVAVLQDALAAAGHPVGDRRGQFGPGTSAALAALYRTRGLAAPATPPEVATARDAARQARHQAGVELERAEGDGNPDQLGAARQALADTDRAVKEATSRVGVVARRAELALVRALPAAVIRVPVRVGDQATASEPLVLGTGRLQLSCVPPPTLEMPPLGLAVVVWRPDGRVFEGTVTAARGPSGEPSEPADVGARAGGAQPSSGSDGTGGAAAAGGSGVGGAPSGAPVTVDLPPEALEGVPLGATVTVDFITATSAGEVLAVPLGALTGTRNDARVELTGPGGFRAVPVEVGLVADGYAEVRPREAGGLGPGDELVVSR